MQLIIPLAGKGTRLRPHTHTRPKPLVHVAGKPVLGHILDSLSGMEISKAVFITGDMEEQIREFVDNNYKFQTDYIRQKELLGDGHAINLAKDSITEDVLIIFVDTIFEADFSIITEPDADGIVWVKEVDDPKRFGIVELDADGNVKSIVEKPDNPPTNLALIGLYYIKDRDKLFEALGEIIERGITSKKEYRLADALSLMMEKGDRIKSGTVSVWEDCGKPETLLSTNRHLLANGNSKVIDTEDSIIRDPVYIENGAKIKGSVIGPNVSIAKDAVIENSIIEDSIINKNSEIRNAVLKESIIGSYAKVELRHSKLNIGDHSQMTQ